MKTLKLIMIAAILVFSVAGVADAGGLKSKPSVISTKKVVILTLEKAIQFPGLVAAMVQQINPLDILNNGNKSYTAQVIYQNVTYQITGSQQEWILFMLTYNMIDNGTST